jgi:hypothetical protein
MQAQSPKDGACRHRASEVKEGRDGKSESGQRLTGTWRSMHIPGPLVEAKVRARQGIHIPPEFSGSCQVMGTRIS